MSMLRDARDAASTLFYLERLNDLRDAHLERSLRGEVLPPEFLDLGESDALAKMKAEFYCLEVRRLFLGTVKADAMTDAEDFSARSSVLAEFGVLQAHRILAGIPWVGHPDYQDS